MMEEGFSVDRWKAETSAAGGKAHTTCGHVRQGRCFKHVRRCMCLVSFYLALWGTVFCLLSVVY